MPLTAIALNCSLKRSSGAESSTDTMIGLLVSELKKHGVDYRGTIRIADHEVKPGVTSDEGEGDEWPEIRRRILEADILIFGSPIWLGQPSSLAKRVVERMDAFLSETDEKGRMPSYSKIALVAVVGNEDGAHHVCAELYQALSDTGWTIPAAAVSYWVGEAMAKTDLRELPQIPEKVEQTAAMAASNAAHLASLLKDRPYPGERLTASVASAFDIVIVGAGAAGIAAGRRLAEAGPGTSFLIVEAAERIGGRAWTVMRDGYPLDLGCGWLHSADRNPWAKLAEETGVPIDRTRPAWGRQFANLGFTREEQREAAEAYEEFDRRLREDPPASDRALDALDPDERWNDYLEARSGYLNGAGLAQLSVADFLAYDEAATDENWRLPDGYGALIVGAAEGLPIALDAPVSRIDRKGTPLLIDTARGSLSARAVIVAVPPAMLAEERLRFDPPLDAKAEAASCLPLGLADKLFLHLDGAEELDADAHMLGNPKRAETGSYYLRPFGRPMIECFFGGAGATILERAGEGAMADFAIEELVAAFGSAFRKRLHPIAGSTWGESPRIRGSYSHAMPGHAEARRALAEPVEGRIFFAGEACSAHDFSTAHGAWESGVAAAERALAYCLGSDAVVQPPPIA